MDRADLGEGKLNYERMKARREFADKLREAHQISRRREDVQMQILVMATVLTCFIDELSVDGALNAAVAIYKGAVEAATAIVPEEVKMDEFPDG